MIKILIAEDEEIMRDTLSRFFEKRGCSVTTASDGLEALDKFKEIEPDIAIMDNHMPMMNGLDVLRALGDDADKVIMMSGDNSIETYFKSIYLGAADFIYKPFDLELMEDIVLSHLKRLEKREDNYNGGGYANVDKVSYIAAGDSRC